MLAWPCVPIWHFARSILNGGRGHSNSRSLGGNFEIGGSGGIRGRRRLRGDTELQPRCYHTGRRAQRRRFEGLASCGDRLRVACCGAGAGAEGEGGGRSERWRCGNAMRDSTARLQCKFEGRYRRAQPRLVSTASHPATRLQGSQVEMRLRARRARAEGEVSDGVAAMRCAIQMRVCNASSKAKAARRNASVD
jgi:hypothetical protein